MNKFIYIIMFLGSLVNAQVSIGKELVANEHTLLDFNDDATNTLGIILPSVTNATDVPVQNGTFIYDINTQKVRMYENGTWRDLSGIGNATNVIIDPSNENNASLGVIIGAETSSTQGVLVLEATDKAMVLPKIANPHLTVEGPYPGMMCYDTVSKSLAVFDGTNWNYWK